MSLQPVSRWESGVTARDAEALASEAFGVLGEAQPLAGERDDNFRIRGDTKEYILKIAHPAELRVALEGQNGAMKALSATARGFQVPGVVESVDGSDVVTRRVGGTSRLVRLLAFVPGIPLVEMTARDADLLYDIGRMLGRMDQALATFHHPGAQRELYWDLRHAGTVVDRHVGSVLDPDARRLVEHFLRRFRAHVMPTLSSLRTSVIHNDANDHNILVDPRAPGTPALGIVDFGDMVESHTVGELAIACAYVMLDQREPLLAAAHVSAGYHQVYPLSDAEYGLLFDLICMRLCVSVTVAASRSAQAKTNSYLAVSEKGAWEMLRRLVEITPRHAMQVLREVP